MKVVQNFEALARSEFAFLECDLEFHYEGTVVHFPEVWTTFQGDEATVVVTSEVGAVPWVVIEFASPLPEDKGLTVGASFSTLLEVAAGSSQLPDLPVERVDDPLLRGDSAMRIQVAEKQREIAARLRNG